MRIVNELKDKTKRLEEVVEGPSDISTLTGGASRNNQTLTEARELLLDNEGRNKNTYRVNSKKKKGNGPSEV